MSTIVELYETLKESIGEKAAKLLTQELDKLEKNAERRPTAGDVKGIENRLSDIENEITAVKGKLSVIETRLDNLDKHLEILEKRLSSLENRIWWIVGLILVQWLSLMMAILFKH